MNRTQKAEFVEEIRGRFVASPLVILTDFKGSTVAELEVLRNACDPVGVRFQVVKNTLCKRALAGTEMEPLADHFLGNVGVLFAGDDPIAAAKVFRDEAKVNEHLIAKVGFFEGDVLDSKQITAVADLPSKEELFSTLLRTLQEGPRQVLGVLQAPSRDLLCVLQNYASKLNEE